MPFDTQSSYFRNLSSKVWIDFLNSSEFDVPKFQLNLFESESRSSAISVRFIVRFIFFRKRSRFTKSIDFNMFTVRDSAQESFKIQKSFDDFMKKLKRLKNEMKKKREFRISMTESNKKSVIHVADEVKFAKSKSIFIDNMFRFLSDSFRSAIIFTNNIILSFLSSELFKLSSDFKFSKISIEIFHDGTLSIKIRSGTVRERVGKLVYMNFKFNHGVYLSVLYDEYEEIVKEKYVIFDKNFVSVSQREVIHNKMLHIHEKIRKNHYEKKLKIVRKWIKVKRTWEAKFILTFYSDYFKQIKFFEIFEKMLKNLKTYCNDDSLHQHDTYMSVSDVDVSEFEKNESKNDIESKKKNQNKKKTSFVNIRKSDFKLKSKTKVKTVDKLVAETSRK